MKTNKEETIFDLLKEGVGSITNKEQTKKDAIERIKMFLGYVKEEIKMDYTNITNGEHIRSARIEMYVDQIRLALEKV